MLDARTTPEAETMLAGVLRFAGSSVGAKMVMALTGIGLWGFIVAHLAGNLAMWAGRDAMNHYAAMLKSVPELLWAVCGALLVMFPLHIITAIRTARLNQLARPVPYVHAVKTEATLASKTMLLSGLLVLCFFVYHLAHFTWHLTNPDHVELLADGSTDVYSMVVRGFQIPAISLVYILAQVLLAEHLSHGLYSMFQHLGLWGKAWTPFLHKAAVAVAYTICFAFISIPVGVMAGALRLA
jgi:succinate dehydrogenase / fumarate reductase cytochrome b subunit